MRALCARKLFFVVLFGKYPDRKIIIRADHVILCVSGHLFAEFFIKFRPEDHKVGKICKGMHARNFAFRARAKRFRHSFVFSVDNQGGMPQPKPRNVRSRRDDDIPVLQMPERSVRLDRFGVSIRIKPIAGNRMLLKIEILNLQHFRFAARRVLLQ